MDIHNFFSILDVYSNSQASGKYGSNLKSIIFKLIIQNSIFPIYCEITQVNATEPHQWEVNILLWAVGSGNGFMLSNHKPLLEPMLIQIYVLTWHHWATMSWLYKWFIQLNAVITWSNKTWYYAQQHCD